MLLFSGFNFTFNRTIFISNFLIVFKDTGIWVNERYARALIVFKFFQQCIFFGEAGVDFLSHFLQLLIKLEALRIENWNFVVQLIRFGRKMQAASYFLWKFKILRAGRWLIFLNFFFQKLFFLDLIKNLNPGFWGRVVRLFLDGVKKWRCICKFNKNF